MKASSRKAEQRFVGMIRTIETHLNRITKEEAEVYSAIRLIPFNRLTDTAIQVLERLYQRAVPKKIELFVEKSMLVWREVPREYDATYDDLRWNGFRYSHGGELDEFEKREKGKSE
jgi:hypothetical protein